MVVTQVVGVGIFLSPATMMRTVGGGWAALAVWLAIGSLSVAGAFCYAELSTRFPEAGGGYVFLREAFGRRVAFIHGWMALLVVDPGLTAALGIGLAQYLLATVGGDPSLTPLVAVAGIAIAGLLTLLGVHASARAMQVTAAAKIAIVLLLAATALVRLGSAGLGQVEPGALPAPAALAPAVIAAFFAFGGWWELGRMSEEVSTPRRTMPRAFIGGLGIVTAIYLLVSLALATAPAPGATTDEAFVLAVGAALFGDAAGRLLSAMVVVAVAGSLAATLLGAPRLYLALARDGLFPPALARVHTGRGTMPASTILQVALASLLALTGSFTDILGYFVPCAVFFLGLSAATILRLPRPEAGAPVFRAPLHPAPILIFLALIAAMLALFAVGQPVQTLAGALVVLLGVPVAWTVAGPGRLRAS
jgi:APA family basic amino acid/polyamine antiporter